VKAVVTRSRLAPPSHTTTWDLQAILDCIFATNCVENILHWCAAARAYERDLAREALELRRPSAPLAPSAWRAPTIVLQRFGENALNVTRNVKDRLAEIAPS
jgi:hypothetical protein